MKNKVAKFILEAKEYPTMKELLDEFLTYSGEDIHFLIAQQELRKEGTIFYDEKHDSWLYTGISNPKLQKLIDESVSLSQFNKNREE